MFRCRNPWRKDKWHNPISFGAPQGYTYLGPCRCGLGPDAFFQDKNGRVVHASQVHNLNVSHVSTAENLKREIDRMKEEKAGLEKRIRNLEKLIKEKE